MMEARLERLHARMSELGVDTFMVTRPENRRWLTGFTGSAGVAFVTPQTRMLATDFRYYEQATSQAPAFELFKIAGRFEAALPDVLRRLGSRRIAFEADDLSYDSYQTYAQALPDGMELVATKDEIRWLRAVKDAAEIDLLRKAIAITDDALRKVRRELVAGMTEKELAWRLEQEMRGTGAASWTIHLIVAAGPASAMAHARATDRPIGPGEPIVIDMGCRWEGYHSDLTRTLILGEADSRFREIYDIVLRAQNAAMAGIHAGMIGREAHALAADVIRQAGYGDRFGHGLGHGVGLDIHELPVLNAFSDHVLKPGMVFSVEPGIYLPGWGGIRIEDLVLLAEDGVVVLSGSEKEPVVPMRQS